MAEDDLVEETEDTTSSAIMNKDSLPSHPIAKDANLSDSKAVDGTIQTETTALLNYSGQQPQEPVVESKMPGRLKQICACPPQGILAKTVTYGAAVVLIWAVVWSITGQECLPGGNLFGILFLFFFAVIGGKLMGLIQLPGLPPLPPLLGMLLVGFLLRNIPLISDLIQIDTKWSAALRSIALAIILARAGLGLDPKALKKLKAVCLRLSFGPCITEACIAAVLAHFLMHLPWIWGFLLGFVLGAVSPAVVVPSMLVLQAGGYGVEKGVPTLLMAAGSFDDILSITGFNTCLGIAFSTGSTVFSILRGFLEVAIGVAAGGLLGIFVRYFPSKDQVSIVWRRAFFLVGLSVFAIFSTINLGFPGSGGLCTIVLAFLASLSWSDEKKEVEKIIGVAWKIFQPFLFGLIGAEISVFSLKPETVGLCVATLSIALAVRITATFLLVSFAGFELKEKIFISLAWIPKATVQAAIGSLALDTARTHQDQTLEQYGMDVLTVAFLAILITAPIGALIIGLAGPRLLHKAGACSEDHDGHERTEEIDISGRL
ncbi:sodium/hydrogen exchanger 9B2 isoform X2 [Sphaerodactylus townsendi]|uniref:Sodium/hydrogen exchanger 9B2 n=3 Tax=Sphaerodactylus townsendi TaxID=933632 RepID=A0ACB8E862_9SAUR|nr:sodium/hydrogen exchanger 9B2 isoform X2 [Sphaerodactylus townsendi]XP_048366194.1 sodium/hydrogen exchanger 9B2 isoform X2 [Sphaerodactylus townsendi]